MTGTAELSRVVLGTELQTGTGRHPLPEESRAKVAASASQIPASIISLPGMPPHPGRDERLARAAWAGLSVVPAIGDYARSSAREENAIEPSRLKSPQPRKWLAAGLLQRSVARVSSKRRVSMNLKDELAETSQV